MKIRVPKVAMATATPPAVPAVPAGVDPALVAAIVAAMGSKVPAQATPSSKGITAVRVLAVYSPNVAAVAATGTGEKHNPYLALRATPFPPVGSVVPVPPTFPLGNPLRVTLMSRAVLLRWLEAAGAAEAGGFFK